ncbi:hypothetical protein A5630_30140 [Mycolicibacterium mucogenicum]|uniref:Uncharacterized protein n=2 Tax=Mycolicibacterium mucogenicum TaxID=56689 RepID=A0A1A3GSK0_MYCMU|nr:hypothetical protein A5630_30140 [Mycolicibacterium mucogenicum]
MVALLICGLVTAACQTPEKPAPPNQSGVFFPATVDTYGLAHSQTDRDHLAELYALRQIDPCGFVDQKTVADNGHKNFSYTYTAVHEISDGGVPPLFPLGGDGCTVALAGAKTGLSLEIIPGEPRATDAQFSPDPAHPNVSKRIMPICRYRAPIPLMSMAGAPASMHDPLVEISPISIGNGRWEFDDTSQCGLAEAIAAGIAAHIQERGIPVHSGNSSRVTKFITSDPCAAAVELHAVGFDWHDPSPDAQWPTTWRHAGVCNLRLQSGSGLDPATAVVRYGLAAWTDNILEPSSGQAPARSDHDGIELYDFSSAPSCFVLAKSAMRIEPVNVGSGAPVLATSTPVVTVRLSAPAGASCMDTAAPAALAAVQRAT